LEGGGKGEEKGKLKSFRLLGKEILGRKEKNATTLVLQKGIRELRKRQGIYREENGNMRGILQKREGEKMLEKRGKSSRERGGSHSL